MSEPKSTNDDFLDTPSFQLPSDFFTNRDRYELWAIRVPVKLEAHSVLNGMSFQHSSNHIPMHHRSDSLHNRISTSETTPAVAHVISKLKAKDRTYGLHASNPREFETFRLLTRDEHSTKEMKPLAQSFDQLINIIDLTPTELSETDIAPSRENAPSMNDDKWTLRIPYQEKKQVRGLKRRWNLYGAVVHDNSTLWNKMQKEKLEGNKSPKQKRSRNHETFDINSSTKKSKISVKKEDSEESPSKKDKKAKKEKHKKITQN